MLIFLLSLQKLQETFIWFMKSTSLFTNLIKELIDDVLVFDYIV